MNDKKIEILLDSFEKLKSKINDADDDYLRTIDDIIEKMYSLDKNIAVNMWEYCLTKYNNYDDDYRYCNNMYFIVLCPFNNYLRNFGIDDTLDLLKSHPIIKTSVFERYYSHSDEFFKQLASLNKLFELDEYLQIIENNRKFLSNHWHDDGIGELLKTLTNYMRFEPTPECVELLLNHAKLANEENQATINVNLIDYL